MLALAMHGINVVVEPSRSAGIEQVEFISCASLAMASAHKDYFVREPRARGRDVRRPSVHVGHMKAWTCVVCSAVPTHLCT